MNTVGKLEATALIAGLLLGLGGPAAAQSLRLLLETDRSEFALGEPVVLYVTLKNDGPGAVETAALLAPDFGSVTYFIAEPGQAEVPFSPFFIAESEAPLQTIQAGDGVQQAVKLFFGAGGWTFRRSGKYRLRAVYERTVASPAVEITIAAPADATTQSAADLLLSSEEAGKFLFFEGGDHLAEGRRRLEHVARKLSESPHAAYANVALAASLVRDFADFTRGELRKADPEQAREFAEQAKGGLPSFYYLVRGYLVLSEAYRISGDAARSLEARREIEELAAERYPNLLGVLAEEIRKQEAAASPKTEER